MIGSYWAFGNDVDSWAYCSPIITVSPVLTAEPNRFWTAEQHFVTPGKRNAPTRCQDASIADPLLEPPKISGSFARYQVAARNNRSGVPILSTSFEPIVGLVKDGTRPSVIFEWNSAVLDIAGMVALINTLNDRTMWGLASRKIKLSNISWSRQLYGLCNYYYTKRFEFEISFSGWDDAEIRDEGFKCLRGKWVSSHR